MLALAVALAAATPSPAPTVDPDNVTPGVAGFFTIFLITVAALVLIVDMTRRVRRVRYRNEAAERREQPPEA